VTDFVFDAPVVCHFDMVSLIIQAANPLPFPQSLMAFE
jgi:hypothetical protein